jgi:hypothetical protein
VANKNFPLILNTTWFKLSLVKEIMNMKKLNVALAILIAAVMAGNAQTTVTSDIVGYYKQAFPAGGSLQTVGLLKAPVFAGPAISINGSTLSVSSSSWTSNQFAPAAGLPTHYVEITSGSMAGYLFDIVSNTGSSVTVNDPNVANAGGTVSFLIRPHTKLSEAFKDTTNLVDYADQVTVYHADGTNISFLRDSSTTSGWLDAGSFSESDDVIYPSQGVVLSASASGVITQVGTVKSTPTVVPLYAGQVNIVSLSNPSGIIKDIQTIGLGTNLADYADQVATYATDGTLATTSALLYGGSTDGWLDAGSFAPATGVNVVGVNPIIVSVTSSTVWKLNSPISQYSQ